MRGRQSPLRTKATRPPLWKPGRPSLALLLTPIFALVLFAPQVAGMVRPAQAGDVHLATGYNQLIDDLVLARGWLSVERRDGRDRVVESDLAPKDKPAWRLFRKHSYLSDDLGDPSRWIVEGDDRRIVQIDPAAHRILGPYSSVSRWQGELLYREGASIAPSLQRVGGGAYPMSRSGAAGMSRITLFQPNPLPVSGGAREYRFIQSEGAQGGAEIATLILVGADQALVRLAAERPGLSVSVSGAPVALDPARPRYVRLAGGDVLAFRSGGKVDQFAFDLTGPRISTPSPLGAGRHRARGLEAFSRGVEAAADAGGDPIRTTLDAPLQGAADRILAAQVAVLPQNRPFRSAVTLMDTRTGEVLAIASRPTTTPEQSAEAGTVRHRFNDQNHNFTALPIGSVAKAPLSMAILQTWPELGTLRIRPGAPGFTELLGVSLPRSKGRGFAFEEHVSGDPEGDGTVDFNRFMSKSSNKYATALMLLGLGDGPVRQDTRLERTPDTWWLGQARMDRPPGLDILSGQRRTTPDGVVPVMSNQGSVRWGAALRDLFGVEYEQDLAASPFAPADRDWSLWGNVFPHHGPYGGIAPELGNLRLNQLSDLKADYLMSVLGGGRSNWSTLKIAEIFSRVVTGRRIEASLVYAPERRLPDAIAFDAGARQTVVDALQRVALDGTGALLGEAAEGIPAPPGQEIRIFAKTGTPNVDYAGETPVARRLVADLASFRCGLVWGERRGVLWYGREVSEVTRLDPILEEMNPKCRQILRRSGLAARDLREELAGINAVAAGGRHAPDILTLGQSNAITAVEATPEMVADRGHAVALVVGRYAVGAPDDSPLRAMTIVVNIQRRTADHKAQATMTARGLLGDPIVRRWLLADQPAFVDAGARR